jgi:hypothetical protein
VVEADKRNTRVETHQAASLPDLRQLPQLLARTYGLSARTL